MSSIKEGKKRSTLLKYLLYLRSLFKIVYPVLKLLLLYSYIVYALRAKLKASTGTVSSHTS